MSDLRGWLESHGLAKYVDTLAEHEIEVGDLSLLCEEDLERLGLPLGPRKRLLAAARRLAGGAPVQPQSPEPAAGGAERRQLTVMFCDLVDSVALGERMEVEDYRELLARFRGAVVDAIKRFDGFVARHQGDGVLVYFGFPHAREDDVERAVRAALAVVGAVETLDHPYDAIPTVRIGIATGDTVVGDVLATGASERAELAALGPTPNLAARLQGRAEPNGIVVSETTARLVSGFFALDALPAASLKGISGPRPAFRVCAERSGETRFSARTAGGLNPFVGRAEDLELLRRRWDRAREGHGQVVLIVGEAGIGKSRLLRELAETVRQSGEVVQLQCSPFLETSALHPVIAAFERVLGTAPATGGAQRLDRLRAHLVDLGEPGEESLALLAQLLSIPLPRLPAAIEVLDAPQRREQTLRVLTNYARRLAARSPTLLAYEDLHWADPSTRELLGRLVDDAERERVLIVATTRPGLEAPWSDLAHVRVLTLSRLERAESEALARTVAAIDAGLPSRLVDTILERAGGNPLFIEELTRAVVQSGAARGSEEHAVPATLQDSLMARLDALARGKPVAQCAAVIGREVPHSILESVWEGTGDDLAAGLAELEAAGLLAQRGEDPSLTHVFKHALVRDAAYGNLLRTRRAALHARTAASLERLAPETAQTRPELLAHHFGEAGLVEQAIEYWHRAARRSLDRSADAETIAHVNRALTLVESLPESEAREHRELDLRLILGPALMNALGSGSAEVGATYQRARALSERIGDVQQRFTAAWGLWLHLQMGGRFDAAREQAERVVALGQEIPDSTYLLQGLHAAWTTEEGIGNHSRALEHAEAGVAIYDRERHRRTAALYGDHDAGVCGRAHLAYGRWFVGRPDGAVSAIDAAIELGEAIAHPRSLALAQCSGAIVHQLRREPRHVLRHSRALMETSTRHGLQAWTANAEIFFGWSIATLEGSTRGIDTMRAALERRETMGSVFRQTYYLAMFAELLGRLGDAREAMAATGRAVRLLERTGERRWAPLVYRVQADLLLERGDDVRAETNLRTALEIARNNGALSLELPVACRLARLWNERGRSDEARALLESVYARFAEGHDTPDLVEAKALLGALA